LITSDVPENAATAVAVDSAIAVAAGSVAAAIVPPMVRVTRFAACAAGATPVVMVVIVQVVPAASVAEATEKVTAALAVPLSATAAVNVLVQHPVLVGALPAASVHVGNTATTVSPTARALEHWKVSTTELAAPAMEFVTTNDVPENAATAVAVDVAIALVVGFMAPATVPPIVRVAAFATCSAGATPVVMSAFVVIVHVVATGSAAVATVNTTCAVCDTLFMIETVKVVVPQPDRLGSLPAVSVHVGSVKTIVSPCASVLEHWNVSTTALAAPAMGLWTTKDVPEKVAAAVAVDAVIAVVTGLMAAAIVAPIVRVARFAACAAGATPIIWPSVVIVHAVAAGSPAIATVSATAAVLCPLFATAAVKVL
jgi:hypothetical protein